jgi:hypothetical protein
MIKVFCSNAFSCNVIEFLGALTIERPIALLFEQPNLSLYTAKI